MPPYISPQFQYHGRKGNQFYDHEFAELLNRQPAWQEGQPVNLGIAFDVQGKNDERYTAELKKSADGKQITLDATLRKGGQVYKTTMTAKQVKDNLYEITELTFDNHKERLDARWEITSVLGHIGDKQLAQGVSGKIPEAHKEKGKFGKIGRFFSRSVPDDLSVWSTGFGI